MTLLALPDHALETVGCRICGGTEAVGLFSVRGFPIVRCQTCGVRYVSRRLKASYLLELYSNPDYFKSDNSWIHGYKDYARERDNIIQTCGQRLNWILSCGGQSRPGRLLDVGCALGFTLEYAADRGWDAQGLEPSRHAVELARQRGNTRVVQGTLDHHPFPNASFDILLLWDVIEHMPDPLHTLHRVHALLAPGGQLSLITPDCGSLLARMMGSHWMEYAKPTEHIYFFSRSTLEAAAGRAGFMPVAVTTAGKYASGDILLERLYAPFPALSFLKSLNGWPFLKKSLYINPHDKMHWLFRKRESH